MVDLGMVAIGWLLVVMMFLGMISISIARKMLEMDDKGKVELSENDRIKAMTILNDYERRDIGGRLAFVIIYGASFLAVALFGWIND